MAKNLVNEKWLKSSLIDVEVHCFRTSEKELDLACRHLMNTAKLPTWLFILINKQSPDSFEELGMVHVALRDAVLHLENFFDAHRSSTLNLLKHYTK